MGGGGGGWIREVLLYLCTHTYGSEGQPSKLKMVTLHLLCHSRYTVHCAICGTLYTVPFAVHCTLCHSRYTVHCAIHGTLYTVPFAVHCTLCYSRYTVHCHSRYTVHCAIRGTLLQGTHTYIVCRKWHSSSLALSCNVQYGRPFLFLHHPYVCSIMNHM